MIRILNAEPLGYSSEARAILEKLGQVTERRLNRMELLTQLPDYDVLIVRLAHQIDQQVIDASPRLLAIVTATTGLDHIDVDYARSRGITVLSLRGEVEFLRTIVATAEHTWALLLALMRKLPQAASSVLASEWDRDRFRGHELRGKRLGLIGLGRVGHQVVRYALAFEMIVAAFDPYASEWPAEVERSHDLPALLSRSDVLSLHVPLSPQTQHLIGVEELAQLPAGAVIVNTARGEVLDETALVSALQSGSLLGAALDVVTDEREPQARTESALLAYAKTHSNLLITPHIGGATYESMARTEVFMAQKLRMCLTSCTNEPT